MKKSSYPTIADLLSGAECIYKNAQHLYEEAVILSEHGRNERSLFLHQISLEECAKIDMIGPLATTILISGKFDLKKFEKSFKKHESKNHINAYTCPASAEESNARESENWEKSRQAFKNFQKEYHRDMNNQKNNSLYVNFADGTFISPQDIIRPSDLENISAQNKYYLEQIPVKLSVMKRMIASPTEQAHITSKFIEFTEAHAEGILRDPDLAMKKLIELHEENS
jgi:AbiV family abortive infection protein